MTRGRRTNPLQMLRAFTLIEVMVSVMIISVVIMALLTMGGNNTHIFASFKKQIQINQYASFFISNPQYGFESDSVDLDDLVSEFDVESDLRKELKEQKVKIIYQVLEQIDMSDFEDTPEEDTQDEIVYEDDTPEDEKQVNSSLVIEIGRTTLQAKDSSVTLLRIKAQ